MWIGQTVGTALGERLKLSKQMAAAGKKESVSLSLCIEVNNVEFEEDTSTVATLFCADFWEDGKESSRRIGGSRSLKSRPGDR